MGSAVDSRSNGEIPVNQRLHELRLGLTHISSLPSSSKWKIAWCAVRCSVPLDVFPALVHKTPPT